MKNKFKINKLFLYSNSFYLFSFIIQKLNNLKIYKFLINFIFILFSFIFYIIRLNVRK